MQLIDASNLLMAQGRSWWSTVDVAMVLDVTNAHASQILRRLAAAGMMIPLARGRWAVLNSFDPLMLPGILTSPLPSYISLYSALYYHGLVSQIPAVVYAVTVGRTGEWRSPAGTASLHHVHTSFFFGYDEHPGGGFMIASPEKALVDLFYMASMGRGRFRSPPEIELLEKFSRRKALAIIKSIRSRRVRTMVNARFATLLNEQS